MALWAIVPIKPLDQGKSRLAEVLTPEERRDLNSRMLAHTLQTLKAVPAIEQVMVVSRDPKALALARELGARTIQENGAPHLNIALQRATQVAREFATRGVLVLPIDLPLITVDGIRKLLDRAIQPPVVVAAPDRRGEGTNALLVYPAGLIKYHFGEGSFQQHCQLAHQAGARLEIVEYPALGLDIDLPEDLAALAMEIQAEAGSL